MGKKLNRREFVKGAAVAIAGAALSGGRLLPVHQVEAGDPGPEPKIDVAQKVHEVWPQLTPKQQRLMLGLIREMHEIEQQEARAARPNVVEPF